MTETPNLQLPYIAPAQAQKHVTHNEAIRALDALVQLSVIDQLQQTPPTSPVEGDRYIVAAGATGAWLASDKKVAAFQDGGWRFYTPETGWRAWVEAAATLVAYDGSDWTSVSSDAGVNPASLVGVNTTADSTNRFSVKSDAVLISHDDVTPGSGDCRVKINKQAQSGTTSLMFQSAYSGRAEIGLTGSDNFECKVSPDGTNWTNAISVSTAGRVGFGVPSPVYTIQVGGQTNQYADSIRVEETGHATSRRATAFVGQWIVGQDIDGNGTLEWGWFDANAQARRMEIGPSGGLVLQNAVGGDQGVGSINAQAVYDDNALLSCYVLDQAIDGTVDLVKWDARVPDRKHQAKVKRSIRSDGEPGGLEIVEDEKVEQRIHEPMRRFLGRTGTAHDPLSLDGYARHWREKRHLTSMPNESAFDQDTNLSTGEWIQRLLETVEIHAVLIEALNTQIKSLSKPRTKRN